MFVDRGLEKHLPCLGMISLQSDRNYLFSRSPMQGTPDAKPQDCRARHSKTLAPEEKGHSSMLQPGNHIMVFIGSLRHACSCWCCSASAT